MDHTADDGTETDAENEKEWTVVGPDGETVTVRAEGATTLGGELVFRSKSGWGAEAVAIFAAGAWRHVLEVKADA